MAADNKLKFPFMRLQTISCLESLSDRQYQIEAWVHLRQPPDTQDSFDLSVHWFYDDTQLADNTESCIGFYLWDLHEVFAIRALVREMDFLFKKHGLDKSDEYYINTVEWDNVLASAMRALSLLTANDVRLEYDPHAEHLRQIAEEEQGKA